MPPVATADSEERLQNSRHQGEEREREEQIEFYNTREVCFASQDSLTAFTHTLDMVMRAECLCHFSDMNLYAVSAETGGWGGVSDPFLVPNPLILTSLQNWFPRNCSDSNKGKGIICVSTYHFTTHSRAHGVESICWLAFNGSCIDPVDQSANGKDSATSDYCYTQLGFPGAQGNPLCQLGFQISCWGIESSLAAAEFIRPLV